MQHSSSSVSIIALPFISNLSISLDIYGIFKDSISKIVSLGCLNAKKMLDELIGLQKKLYIPIYFKSKGNLLNRSTTRNKARLLSLSGNHAGAWLLAVPNCFLIPLNIEYILDICWAYISIIYLVYDRRTTKHYLIFMKTIV